MLHERIRDENKIAGNPTADCNRERSREMATRPESFLAPDERTDECALEKKREHSFHRQRLADYAAGVSGEVGPIGSKLKFHRNSGDDADGKIQSKDFGPKPDSSIVFLVTGLQRAPFPVNQKPRQPQSELRKKIVINQR